MGAKSIDTYLNEFVQHGSIPMSFLQSETFIEQLKAWGHSKNEALEKLFYSRNKAFEIDLSRDSARVLVLHNDVFDSDGKVKEGVDIFLGAGARDFKYYSKSNSDRENVKGTKFIALEQYESQNGLMKPKIISSRHSLLDLMLLFFKRSFFTLNVVLHGDQIYVESARRQSTVLDEKSMTGFNLESVLTTDSSKDFVFKPALDNSVKYNSMVLHEFPSLSTSILISCEIDAVVKDFEKLRNQNDLDSSEQVLGNYIELKSKASLSRLSLLVPLLQCYLSGTKILKIGIRDKDSLILKEVVNIDVPMEIDRLANDKGKLLDKWLAFICKLIEMSTLKVKLLARGRYTNFMRIVFDKRGDRLKFYPYLLSKEHVEATVLPRYLEFRDKFERPSSHRYRRRKDLPRSEKIKAKKADDTESNSELKTLEEKLLSVNI